MDWKGPIHVRPEFHTVGDHNIPFPLTSETFCPAGMEATKMDKMLLTAYKMLEEKGQHVLNPTSASTTITDAGQSAGIEIHCVGMTALMWKCLPNITRKELTTTPWFSNMQLGRAHARGAEPPTAMRHPLLLSYAAGESKG